MKARILKKFEDEIQQLDRELKTAAKISFHPNINTRTFTVTVADFMKFLGACGNAVQHVSI